GLALRGGPASRPQSAVGPEHGAAGDGVRRRGRAHANARLVGRDAPARWRGLRADSAGPRRRAARRDPKPVGRPAALRGDRRPRARDRRGALRGAPYGRRARRPRGAPLVMLAPIKQAPRRWAPRPRPVGPAAPVASVAVNMRPTESSWGGGN